MPENGGGSEHEWGKVLQSSISLVFAFFLNGSPFLIKKDHVNL